MANAQVGDFETLCEEISDMKIKDINFEAKSKDWSRNFKNKTILFVYREIFDFSSDNREITVFVSKNFVSSVKNLLYSDI